MHNLPAPGSANCFALGVLPALLACWFPAAKSRQMYAIVDRWGSIVLQDANKKWHSAHDLVAVSNITDVCSWHHVSALESA